MILSGPQYTKLCPALRRLVNDEPFPASLGPSGLVKEEDLWTILLLFFPDLYFL